MKKLFRGTPDGVGVWGYNYTVKACISNGLAGY